MTRKCTVVLLFTFAIAIGDCRRAISKQSEIAERYRCAVVKILIHRLAGNNLVGGGWGTGFFVDDHGDMLTATHILTENPVQPGQVETRVSIRADGTSFNLPPYPSEPIMDSHL